MEQRDRKLIYLQTKIRKLSAQMRMQSAQKEQHKVMVRLDNRTHVLVAPQNVTPEYIEMLRKKYQITYNAPARGGRR